VTVLIWELNLVTVKMVIGGAYCSYCDSGDKGVYFSYCERVDKGILLHSV